MDDEPAEVKADEPEKLRKETRRLLEEIRRLHYVTAEILEIRLGSYHPDALRRRLRELARLGYLSRWHYGRFGAYGGRSAKDDRAEQGAAASVYALAPGGLAALGLWNGGRRTSDPAALKRAYRFLDRAPSHGHLAHTLGLSRLQATIEQAVTIEARAGRWYTVGFHRDDDPRKGGMVKIGPDPTPAARQASRYRVRRPFGGGAVQLRADSRLVLTRDAGTEQAEEFTFLVELDRGTEDLKLERKIRAWWAYGQLDPLPGYPRGQEPEHLQVLIVVENADQRAGVQERLRRLEAWQAAVLPTNHPERIAADSWFFLFLSLEDLTAAKPSRLLVEPVVQTASGQSAYLLPPRRSRVDK